jgi:DNA end-binding protein Ku
VVIRTREYLAAVVPKDEALMLLILRFAQELVDPEEYKLPEGGLEKWKITTREVDMAKQLIESMSSKWEPEDYKDDFRERLSKVIDDRVKSKHVVRKPVSEESLPENAATNVIDFADLLKRSLEKKGGKPAPAAKKTTKKTAAKKTTTTPRKRTGRKSA